MGMLELKQVLRPCRMIRFAPEREEITIRNLRYFTALTDLDLYWSVECEGRIRSQGRIPELPVSPQTERTFRLPLRLPSPLSGNWYLNLSFRLNHTVLWADAGYEVGREQVRLPSVKNSYIPDSGALIHFPFIAEETENRILISDTQNCYEVDRRHGWIHSWEHQGVRLLSAPIVANIWRAPTDNDRIVKELWKEAGYDRMNTICHSCSIAERTPERICVKSEISMGAAGKGITLRLQLWYLFVRDGVEIRCQVRRTAGDPYLPRFGLTFELPEGFEQLSYFGRGESESYQDKCHASVVGRFSTTVTDHFEHYIRPQENMAHTETDWVEILNAGEKGIRVFSADAGQSFSFNCSHYTAAQLTETTHDYALVALPQTVVCLDYCQSGIGSNSCGPELEKSLCLQEREFQFAVRFSAV